MLGILYTAKKHEVPEKYFCILRKKLGATHQPIAGTTVADPHVVYSNATPLNGGESVPSRGFHPYVR